MRIKIVFIIAWVLVLQAVAALAFVYSGLFSVASTSPHSRFTWWLTSTAMVESVRRHAEDIKVPELSSQEALRAGFAQYVRACEFCHGGPGTPPASFALGLEPPPPFLMDSPQHWNSAELFWIIKHGIKMTGMPAWTFSKEDEDIWAIVAFLERLPELSPAEYRRLRQQAVDD